MPCGSKGAKARVILLTRYPRPGHVKTRLFSALGPQKAADLQRQMTAHALEQMRFLRREKHVELEVRYCGAKPEEARALFGQDIIVRDQGAGDLGAKILRAFEDARREGVEKAVLLGADCPDATWGVLAGALEALTDVEVVLGPAADGGYYLIGMRSPLPQVFEGMTWGVDTVYEETLRRIKRVGSTWRALKVLHDVDRPEDLRVWERIRSLTD